MESIQIEKFDQLFEEAKAYSQAEIARIYKGIAQDVLNQPPERLAQAILKQESPKVNDFILQLQKRLKGSVCNAVVALGLSEAVAGIIWAKAMNQVEMPTVSLCKAQNVQAAMPEQKKSGPTKEQKAEINRLTAQRNVSMGISATGLAVGVVTCLIVPGWTGISAVAKVTKVASVIVMGAGAAGTVMAQNKIVEINRIIDQMQQQAPTKESFKEIVNKICEHQFAVNAKIICQWLDRIKKEIIELCHKELGR